MLNRTRSLFRSLLVAGCVSLTALAPAQDEPLLEGTDVDMADIVVPADAKGISPAESAAARPVAGVLSQDEELGRLVNDAIAITSRRYLTAPSAKDDAGSHTPWQIMHGLLALRGDYLIKVDGEKTNALEWLSSGQKYRGLPIIERTEYGGRFHTFTEPYAFEGHPNQFLAILSMSELPQTYEMKAASGGVVTIADMINNAKMDVNDREEITWTLWALALNVPPDTQWYNRNGEHWSVERLVQIQTYAEVNNAACGGTHGLFALSLARNSHLATGAPLRGIWIEADQKIRQYVQSAKKLQNPDGSFSTRYFVGPEFSREFGKRIATSGHILEFLMVGAQDADLEQPWLQNAIRAVASDLIENRRAAADCGPLYHALHALVLYRDRVGLKPTEPVPAQPVTASDSGANGDPAPATKEPMTESGAIPVEPPRTLDLLSATPIGVAGAVPPRQIEAAPGDVKDAPKGDKGAVAEPVTDPKSTSEGSARPVFVPVPRVSTSSDPQVGAVRPAADDGSRTVRTDPAAPAGTGPRPVTVPAAPARPMPVVTGRGNVPGGIFVERESDGLQDAPRQSEAPGSGSKPPRVAAVPSRVRTPEDNAPKAILDDAGGTGDEVPLPPTED